MTSPITQTHVFVHLPKGDTGHRPGLSNLLLLLPIPEEQLFSFFHGSTTWTTTDGLFFSKKFIRLFIFKKFKIVDVIWGSFYIPSTGPKPTPKSEHSFRFFYIPWCREKNKLVLQPTLRIPFSRILSLSPKGEEGERFQWEREREREKSDW